MTSGPTPFLKQLWKVDADALLERVRRKTMTRSDVIMHEGSAGENVALVLGGRVKLEARGVGDRTVVLAIRGPPPGFEGGQVGQNHFGDRVGA